MLMFGVCSLLGGRNNLCPERDQSPLIIEMEVCPPSTLRRAPWKLNAFWLNLLPSPSQILQDIVHFWGEQADYLDVGVRWDTFKAFLRGLFIRDKYL